MMDKEHCDVELPLELAQVAKQRGHFFGGIFVASVQADKRVEDEERGVDRRHGLTQLGSILRQVEQKPRGGDDVDGKRIQMSVGGSTDALEPFSDHGKCVFGGKQQHWSGVKDPEATQAGSARGYAHCHIQGQKALAALGFSAENAYGPIGPKPFDEPLGLIGRIGKFACAFYG